jgi:glutathionyl-hydroquinone reductase
MKESLSFLLDFNPYKLSHKFLNYLDCNSISDVDLDNEIKYQVLYFKKLYNTLEFEDRELVKAKFLLNGKVNEAHLNLGSIIFEKDSHLYSLYKADFVKVSYHKYYEASLIKTIYSLFEAEDKMDFDSLDFQKSDEKLKERVLLIVNKAIPAIEMDFVFEQLKSLTHTIPLINEQYLSHEEFERFIRIGFGFEDLHKVTANIPRNHQRRFIKVFHTLFDKSCSKYSIPNRMKPFISIIERSFSNFTREQIIQNMRS